MCRTSFYLLLLTIQVDLSVLRGRGVQPGEALLPDAPPDTPAPVYDEALLAKLVSV